MKLTRIALNYLIEQLKNITLSLLTPEPGLEPLTPRREAMLEAIKGWGSEYKGVVRFASVLEQFDFQPYMNKSSESFKPGTLYVVLGNLSVFEKGDFAFVFNKSGDAWSMKRKEIAEELPGSAQKSKYIRLATKEEAHVFYSEILKMDPKTIGTFVKMIMSNLELKLA